MSFTVHARVSLRAFCYQHGSIVGALEQGLSLLTAGMQEVRIVDGNGRSHTPMALYAQLFAPKIIVDETVMDGSVEDETVAEPIAGVDFAALPLAA